MENHKARLPDGINNFEDTIVEMEALLSEHAAAPPDHNESDVDILDCKVMPHVRQEDRDMTEHSSSFGATVSGDDNCPGLEDEVESQFQTGNELPSSFDTFNSLFKVRKKQVTNHWRNFIRPIIWRCKWAELKIKETQSQALKYEAELGVYDKMKQSFSDQCASDGFVSKSFPFSNPYYNKKAMKRRRRKRVEDPADVNAYMANHYLFSYFENKRTHPNGLFTSDDFRSPVVRDRTGGQGNDMAVDANHGQFFELRKGGEYPDQTLWKIELAQARIRSLIGRMEALMSARTDRTFSHGLNPAAAALSPTPSPEKDDTVSAPLLSDSDAECRFIATPCPVGPTTDILSPDAIGTGARLLSVADVSPSNHPRQLTPLEKEEEAQTREGVTVADVGEDSGGDVEGGKQGVLWSEGAVSRCGQLGLKRPSLAEDSGQPDSSSTEDELGCEVRGGRRPGGSRLAGVSQRLSPHLGLPMDVGFPNKRKRRGGFQGGLKGGFRGRGRWKKASAGQGLRLEP